MQEELNELLELAMYKEIASEAFYIAGQLSTDDPGARALMKELAEEEAQHLQFLKAMKDSPWTDNGNRYSKEKVADLKLSDYITGPDKLEGASLQETLIFAMNREKLAVEFYSKMLNAFRSGEARNLCEMLAQEESKHKFKLESFYNDLLYEQY